MNKDYVCVCLCMTYLYSEVHLLPTSHLLYLQAMWTKDSDVYDTNLYVKYDDKKFQI